jgi:osmotically-inducible protein OsmY
MKTDRQLQADVLAELEWDPQVQRNEIGVIAKDGAVTLTGVVQSYAEKVAAERAAKRVNGVRAIAQDIQVKLPDEMRESDEGIAEKFARLVAWTSPLRDTDVIAEVQNGYVTLTGEVDHPYQKQVAVKRVGELDGVIALTNDIRVRARPSEANAPTVARQITSALHRHASIEASNIHVSVEDGKVTLEGTIPTYAERELVEDAALATAGVKDVENRLLVG